MRTPGRLRWLLVALLAATTNVAGAGPSTMPAAGPAADLVRLVRDPAGRFEITVPALWEVRTTDGQSGVVALVARAPGAPGGVAPELTVTVERVESRMTSDAYARASLALFRTVMHGLRVLNEAPAPLGGASGYSRTLTWVTGDGIPVYAVQTYVTSGVLGLVATGSTRNEPPAIARDAPILQRIVTSLRALETGAAPRPAPSAAAPADLVGRRDLFAPPAGAAGRAGAPLPQVPSANGLPLPPLPGGAPVPPPSLGAAGSPGQPAPLPRLAAVITGPVPQAVLQSGTAYTIVREGDHTAWGRVAAIHPSSVVLDSGSGTQTISWVQGGSR
mgnify:CR=1 FL=1